ncbi:MULTISPECIES: ATP-binding protein [unclassified Streptomyces]|uniref:ATP-binding protein n=1 Tax=unclassified Streptomyces TaxID=2593676 RepID=UPI00163C52AD|nr:MULTISPECIES: LuxR C-terminal-related transcriptional regulator [unclassified Streptomyces]
MPKADLREARGLPAELTTFVGRRRELAEARQLLARTRLLTLTGPGGVGKTRLALRLASESRRAFASGVCFVELAALEDETLLANTIAAALGVNDQSGQQPLVNLTRMLADQQMLLVLDNCEHLLRACALLTGKLLSAAPELRILATSRQALGTEGETVLAVPPLRHTRQTPDPGPGQSDAVRLFEERAAAVVPDFAVTDENRKAVDDICRRLDGIPLAIELAAVRMRVLSVSELLERLDDRFALLTTGSRAALPRQQTLRAAIDWSYGLCSPPEREAWTRLSVFSGGFDLEAAGHVVAGDDVGRGDVFDLVAGLVDKSVLARQRGAAPGTRYTALETLRQYGLERLERAGRTTAARTGHRDYFHLLSARAREEWFSPLQVKWHHRLADDLANLRTAFDFSLEQGDQDTALAIASNLGDYWMALNLREGNHWLDRALAATPGRLTGERIRALWVGAWMATLEGDTQTAVIRLDEARALAQRAGDREAAAHVDQVTGVVALYRGEAQRAGALLRSALREQQERDDAAAVCVTVFYLAQAAAWRGEADTHGWAEQCLALCDAHGALWSRSYALYLTAYRAWSRGERDRAEELLRESLRSQRVIEDHRCFALCAETLAWLAEAEGRHERSARLMAVAGAAWHRMGTSLRGLAHVAAFHDKCEARLRTALGERRYEEARLRGAGLSHGQAVDYALEEPATPSEDAARQAGATVLTPRETEVARLVGDGLSNREIAARLVISPRTVEAHVDHILHKLGFTSRTRIAAWVAAQRRASDG